jgi:DUF1707 SHOCT-like domain
MRAGDADRQLVADRLRTAVDEGRLSLDEYDQRLSTAYAAKTYGDLDNLLADLPGKTLRPADQTVATTGEKAPAEGVPEPRAWVWAAWSGWFSVALINIGIWIVASLASDRPVYFWPIWVFGPWGVILLLRTLDRVGPKTRYRKRHPRRYRY